MKAGDRYNITIQLLFVPESNSEFPVIIKNPLIIYIYIYPWNITQQKKLRAARQYIQ